MHEQTDAKTLADEHKKAAAEIQAQTQKTMGAGDEQTKRTAATQQTESVNKATAIKRDIWQLQLKQQTQEQEEVAFLLIAIWNCFSEFIPFHWRTRARAPLW